MEDNSKEIGKLVAESKKLRELSKSKQNLETVLTELTLCNNLAVLARKPSQFHQKVLKISWRIVCDSRTPSQYIQTLLISVENVSEKFVFNPEYWQFCLSFNEGRTQSSWSLESGLGPGHKDKFCCPLIDSFNFVSPQKFSLMLKFAIQFDSKTFTKSFVVQNNIIDVLHCLDNGRLMNASSIQETSNHTVKISRFLSDDHEDPKVSFPPVTKFLLRLDSNLKTRFLREILLCDSLHRGFEYTEEELDALSELTVFFAGNKIVLSLAQNFGTVSIKCSNPVVLCALKVSILKRLAFVKGIVVEALDDINSEKLHKTQLNLKTFQTEDILNVDVDELMEFYLDLRDVSESIQFSVIQDVE